MTRPVHKGAVQLSFIDTVVINCWIDKDLKGLRVAGHVWLLILHSTHKCGQVPLCSQQGKLILMMLGGDGLLAALYITLTRIHML